jgi:hypothetical protein
MMSTDFDHPAARKLTKLALLNSTTAWSSVCGAPPRRVTRSHVQCHAPSQNGRRAAKAPLVLQLRSCATTAAAAAAQQQRGVTGAQTRQAKTSYECTRVDTSQERTRMLAGGARPTAPPPHKRRQPYARLRGVAGAHARACGFWMVSTRCSHGMMGAAPSCAQGDGSAVQYTRTHGRKTHLLNAVCIHA